MDLKWNLVFEQLGPSLLQGIAVVCQVTFFSFLLAMAFGLLIAIGRISRFKILKVILAIFVEIIRGTPLLVQLFYIYYVVPILLNLFFSLFGMTTDVQFTAIEAGIAGLTINYGTYMSEVFRSAIISIDKGQEEAGLALGFTGVEVLFKIVIPQAFRNSVPVFGNYLVMMIKDTSLLAIISVNELLLRTQTYASQTFSTIESYTLLALVYLLLSIPLSQLMKLLERRLATQ
ncbi:MULTISPECIES: amino acid ABC transporter permease [unclassified Enterococcus]|uniref:amino acid ABC transporter permease n=1 Tax=unclassified Enterococcus TaxID=2608891 RepID=UPI0015551494|nr:MULTISPECIES: amino acid ABC transporter permease [unclassified Enterococcus]MBS7577333.1 amino acid ABC transporter permease [Enterococcus sp. MMGLQ5-2]MBS7584574.1 amino acid ABC transporter permease [Enterococcus sp. MMGLQ5-1]NPD12429.1 amino acid ABC transporter permease [Enterococcus sp. MMGLQ5-1]NPD37167.1 amino acid ABC transporter permease [Enterococcus sp. MMGLQ5-2]